MLDYLKLGEKVDALTKQATKEDFESWLIRDDLRMRQAFLESGCAYKFINNFVRITPEATKERTNPPNVRVSFCNLFIRFAQWI